ncbi:MAG TPA: hypothetical protein VJ436_13670 [Anaerolineales bacterium]|nr:hypothetical protein [Anaerolineales bacterium]
MEKKGRLFLIHWNEGEAGELLGPLLSAGWEVEVEAKDGARAGSAIKANPPRAVVIYLTRLPSHGRETAHALRSFKATRTIPIIFVDGKDEALEKTKAKVPDAIFARSTELESILADLV